MIMPMITGASLALRTLEQLLGSQQSSTGASANSAFSAGQSLPAGAAANTQGGSSGPFAPATLGFLTSLQDPNSQGWSGAGAALGQDLTNLASAVSQLQQALGGSTSASTSSAGASTLGSLSPSLLSQTTSSLAQALNQLNSTLQTLGGLGGHHHHHWDSQSFTQATGTMGSTSIGGGGAAIIGGSSGADVTSS